MSKPFHFSDTMEENREKFKSREILPNNPIAQLALSVLKSGDKTDLILRCKEKDFKVHQVFVCPQSTVLAAAMNGQFKESKTGVIEMVDDEVETVKKMVDFLYTTTYQPCSALLESAKIYVLGDKYDIPTLRRYAATELKELMTDVVDKWNIYDLLAVMELIYTQLPESDEGIKDTFLEQLCASPRYDEVLKSSAYKTLDKELGSQGGQLSYDIIRAQRKVAANLVKTEKMRNASKTIYYVVNCDNCVVEEGPGELLETGTNGTFFRCRVCEAYIHYGEYDTMTDVNQDFPIWLD